jgi:hypothetical protein
MRRRCISTVWNSLTLMTLLFLAAMFAGCSDPIVADMEAERQGLGLQIEQDLQRYRVGPQLYSRALSPPPAQTADMAAERRALDRMVEQGLWRNLTPLPPSSQTEAFHPAP